LLTKCDESLIISAYLKRSFYPTFFKKDEHIWKCKSWVWEWVLWLML